MIKWYMTHIHLERLLQSSRDFARTHLDVQIRCSNCRFYFKCSRSAVSVLTCFKGLTSNFSLRCSPKMKKTMGIYARSTAH